MTDFERRRGSAYVLRLAAEPEYRFMPALLARVDEARARLGSHEKPSPRTQLELDALRESVSNAADSLGVALSQARLLADAALVTHAGWLTELGLDAKPRKRTSRTAAATGVALVDPAIP
jgi:hypothetical protein